MTRKQKKELGVLPRQVMMRARKLAKEGVIERGMTAKEAAAIVAFDIASDEETYDSWERIEVGEVDWDAILAFIEKLLAILLPLFTE